MKKRNMEKFTEIKHSGNVIVEDERIFEKEDVKKKKKKVNMDKEKDDLKDVEITGHDSDLEVKKKVEGEKMKRKKGQTKNNSKKRKRENTKCMEEINGVEENGSGNPKADKENKKNMRFSNDGLVRGKRFSPEEDEIVKEAVYKYLEEHSLGEEGLNMILKPGSHPEIKHCWGQIAKAIPYRPKSAISRRANRLFRSGDKRKWTKEECALVRKYQGEHGNKWKNLAEIFGRHETHVRNLWTRIKMKRNKGRWSQDEYQNLFNLVNVDLQLKLKLSEEKKSRYGMLRDNIHWGAISDKMTTRAEAKCCQKWYNQLTSPMVEEGLWADVDDYRLISELFRFDSSCIEDLDWDSIMEHRSGEICRKRWNQMVVCIGENGNKSFAEQVDILAKRYCPHLLEVRENWDNKPFVDEESFDRAH